MASADVALSPGPRETFGLGVLEAMACGTPVVVSAGGASRELLAPGAGHAATGATQMALAARRILADPCTHARAGAAARRRAEQFSWAATVRALSVVRSTLTGTRSDADPWGQADSERRGLRTTVSKPYPRPD